jgi:hypothetical protein
MSRLKVEGPVAVPQVVENTPPEVAPEQPPAQPARVTAFRMLASQNVPLGGGMTLLPKGEVIRESSYGPTTFNMLLNAGLKMEPVAE